MVNIIDKKNNNVKYFRFLSCIPFVVFILFTKSFAQPNLPYSFELDQELGKLIYSPNTKHHTASKSYLLEADVLRFLDSIQKDKSVNSKKWFARKLFNEHLIQVIKIDHSFYADFLPNMYLGKDITEDQRNIWMNSRGVQAGLTIKDKFSYYTSFYESQAVFPNYIDSYINENLIIPGQATVEFHDRKLKDWMYSTANMTYKFSPYVHATLAYDKNFIGDGYRSMLLSDFSSNYTHLKITGTIGNVHYTSIIAYINDPTNPRLSSIDDENMRFGDGIKWGAFEYFDWNITNRFSVGLFNGLVWSVKDNRINRPEDINFTHTKGKNDNKLVGFTSKYKLSPIWTTYGQFVLGGFNINEFFSGNGYAGNKWASQFGIRGHDVLGVRNLNLLVEFNSARPYMYMNNRPVSNYSNNGEPIAHPQGANFREILAIAKYSWNRFYFQGQLNYVQKGTDRQGDNFGGDIFNSYRIIPNLYGNAIGQGVKNDIYYTKATVAYVLNPKYNLRLEAGYIKRNLRVHEPEYITNKSDVFLFGLRSSFRNIYSDI